MDPDTSVTSDPDTSATPDAETLDEAARAVLLETAGRYNAVITYKGLGTEIQERTGLVTKQMMHKWVGEILVRVDAGAEAREEPLLSSLVVNAQGTVGAGYANAVFAARGEKPEEADDHAARERLACYRHFGAEGLPVDGGRATLTPLLAARRDRERKVRRQERVIPVCPSCNHALASTGACDNCD